MAFSDTPKIGVDLAAVYKTDEEKNRLGHRLGSQIFGSDGKRYVFAQANATISAGTSACAVNDSTFLVAASGGSYTSPDTAMATGDQAWFAADSV